MSRISIRRSRLRRAHDQAGFMLLELMLTMVIISAFSIMGLAQQVEELGDTRMVAQGKAMVTLQAAQNSYITAYYNELLSGLPITLPGGAHVVDPFNPTLAELIALNVGLPASFNTFAFNGGQYRVKIINNGGQLEALAWVDRPFLASNGRPDLPRLGVASQAIGPDAGFSTTTSPSTYKTRAMAAEEANPAGAVAGILVARSGYNTLSMQAFLRRDGSLAMTGDLRMGARSINDAKDVSASGTVAAGTVNASNGTIGDLTSTAINTGSLSANTMTANTGTISALTSNGIVNNGAYTGAGLVRTTGDVEAANLTTAGTVKAGAVETSTLTASGNLTVSGAATMGSQTVTGSQTIMGDTTVQGALVPGLIASGGGWCGAHPGAIARDASNNLYICN
jgi:type II secretory pathway pseudopilin PulG